METVAVKVSKWGNSLGIRLPARSAARAGISEKTIVRIESDADSVTLRPVRESRKTRSLKQLLRRVRPIRDKEAGEWLAMEPAGKEAW